MHVVTRLTLTRVFLDCVNTIRCVHFLSHMSLFLLHFLVRRGCLVIVCIMQWHPNVITTNEPGPVSMRYRHSNQVQSPCLNKRIQIELRWEETEHSLAAARRQNVSNLRNGFTLSCHQLIKDQSTPCPGKIDHVFVFANVSRETEFQWIVRHRPREYRSSKHRRAVAESRHCLIDIINERGTIQYKSVCADCLRTFLCLISSWINRTNCFIISRIFRCLRGPTDNKCTVCYQKPSRTRRRHVHDVATPLAEGKNRVVT